ncbi:MAG: hypothetical protein IBX52_08720 [Bacterioplanes sp.]|nr:hypothetical protein [Bacterioplanes sp.]
MVLLKSIFTVLLAWQAAQLTWLVIAPTPLYLKAPVQGTASTSANSLQGTARYHLFGEAKDEPVAVVEQAVSAPETRLRLSLLGVTRATQQDASSAIISPRGGTGDFYRIGDVVQGRTRLAAVYDDRVILDTNGQLETLKFEDDPAVGVNARAVPTSTPTPRATSSGLRERFQQVTSASEFLDMASEAANADPAAALRELGLVSNGDGQGYRVGANSMLQALQLQSGDVILSINGQGLGDPSTDQMLFEQVRSAGSARIEVQRGNSRFVVNHSLN